MYQELAMIEREINSTRNNNNLTINKWVWKMLCFERRFVALSKIWKNNAPSKVVPDPSDLDEVGCKNTGKTCPVVPVVVPRPENAK
jgi:hypothetical protein